MILRRLFIKIVFFLGSLIIKTRNTFIHWSIYFNIDFSFQDILHDNYVNNFDHVNDFSNCCFYFVIDYYYFTNFHFVSYLVFFAIISRYCASFAYLLDLENVNYFFSSLSICSSFRCHGNSHLFRCYIFLIKNCCYIIEFG